MQDPERNIQSRSLHSLKTSGTLNQDHQHTIDNSSERVQARYSSAQRHPIPVGVGPLVVRRAGLYQRGAGAGVDSAEMSIDGEARDCSGVEWLPDLGRASQTQSIDGNDILQSRIAPVVGTMPALNWT